MTSDQVKVSAAKQQEAKNKKKFSSKMPSLYNRLKQARNADKEAEDA